MTYETILKNFITFLTVVFMMFIMSNPVYAADASGTCGEGVVWSLNDGNLTIEGSGAMTDYTEQNFAPWNEQREEIQSITISDGITSIGDLAFYHCTNLTTVNIPGTVEKIGDYSFAGCTNLVQLNLAEGLLSIGQSAFDGCESLNNVHLPGSLKTLQEKAFYRCSSLGGITIPYNTTDLGMNVFGYCYNLVYVRIDAPITVLPYWFFYGCSRLDELYLPKTLESIQENALAECLELSYVNYDGDEIVRNQIEEALKAPTLSEKNPEVDVNVNYKDSGSSIITTTQTKENIVDKDGNSIPMDTQIHVNINDENGWQDIITEVNNKDDNSIQSTTVNVELSGSDVFESEVLADLLGKEVLVNIHTNQNVYWQIDMADQNQESVNGKQSLQLSIRKNENAADWQKEIIGDATSYIVEFGDTSMNSTVLIPLGTTWARYTATLYKIDNKALEKIQSVIVDNLGRAAFTLAGTAKGEYLIALNAEGISLEETEIPQALYDEYTFEDGATLMDSRGNRYKITRRESDWGLNINQVTWILVAVMLVCVTGVGVTMYILNKRKQILSTEKEWNRK